MRDLFKHRRGDCGCCPGHDKFPNETYNNKRSKKARPRDLKTEHQLVRQLQKRGLQKEIKELK